MSASEHLTTRQAAAILNISVNVLALWRSRRRGPPFYRFGRAVRYGVADLKQWAALHRFAVGDALARTSGRRS